MMRGLEKRCSYARVVEAAVVNHFVWDLWEKADKEKTVTQHGASRGTPADEFFKMARDVATLVSQMSQVQEKLEHIEGDLCGSGGVKQRVRGVEDAQARRAFEFKVWKTVLTTIGMAVSFTWGVIVGAMPWVSKIIHAILGR